MPFSHQPQSCTAVVGSGQYRYPVADRADRSGSIVCPSPFNPVGTSGGAGRIGLASGGIAAVDVPHPFRHIAALIVGEQLIGIQGPDIVGGVGRVAGVPGHISNVVAAAVGVIVGQIATPGREHPYK